MSEWFLYQNETQTGPFTDVQIKDMIAQGGVSAADYVYGGAYADWTLLSDIAEFSGLIPETFYFYKNETQTGPFNTQQINEMLSSGELTENDYYFDSAANDWKLFANSELAARIYMSAPEQSADVSGVSNTQTQQKEQKKIEFPCKNHPDVESFLLCPVCGNDFCENCLIEVNEKHYCKECYAAHKDKITSGKPSKSGGFFSKLFGKK